MQSPETYLSVISKDDSFYIESEPSLTIGQVNSYLDEALAQGSPRSAYAIEDELLYRVDALPRITSRIARLSAKAIAIAQFARQHDIAAQSTKDTTYQNLGKLTEKILSSAYDIRRYMKYDEDAYAEHRNLIGVLSETAIYMLLGFDNKMEHSLSGRNRELPVHYTVPAYQAEDHGIYDRNDEDATHYAGFDFKLFTSNKNERVIPLQVKTSLHGLGERIYTPDITVVTLDKILPENQHDETLLATVLAEDAAGHYSSTSKRQINTAVRNLDRLIISGGVRASSAEPVDEQ